MLKSCPRQDLDSLGGQVIVVGILKLLVSEDIC